MLRVVLGRARPDTEWSGKISGLQFNTYPGGGTQASVTGRSRSQGTGDRFGTNTIRTVLRSHFEPEVDVDLEAGDVNGDMDVVAGRGNIE
jgi:hypothetical protein